MVQGWWVTGGLVNGSISSTTALLDTSTLNTTSTFQVHRILKGSLVDNSLL